MSTNNRQIKVIKRDERTKTRDDHEREHQIVLMYVWMEKYFDKAVIHIERIRANKRQAA
jgi:hypothetical protein